MRKLLSIMALFVISLLAISLAAAADGTPEPSSTLGTVEILKVEVDGDEDLSNVVFEEGDTLDIEVWFENKMVAGKTPVDAEDVEVMVKLSNYKYGVLAQTSDLFDVEAGQKKKVSFDLTIPNDYKDVNEEETVLHVMVFGGDGSFLKKEFNFFVESPENNVEIVKVYFAPSNSVQAGRSLLANVVVENTGEHEEDDVSVTVSLPALGVQATEVVETLAEDDREDVPEMFLPIPTSAAPGTYDVVVSVEYDNFHKVATQKYSVNVVASEMLAAEEKLLLAVGPQTQTVAAGTTARYGVALANEGTSTKAYTIEVVTGDWATASVSEVLVVLEPGKSKTVFVDVTPAAATPAGTYTASVSVVSGSETLETVPLTANVVAASSNVSLRNGLEIALIVLVVLLVIIGLIIGFTRLRRDEGDEEQTYY